MSIFSKAADFFGLSEDNYDEYEVAPGVDGYETVVDEEIPVKQSHPVQESISVPETPKADKKVVSLRQNMKTPTAAKRQHNASLAKSNASKITILEPRNYQEVKKIAQHVLNGEAVLVNFQSVEEDQARRIVDFLTGTVYAQDGDIKRVGDEIFLCTPCDVEIDGQDSLPTETDLYDLN
ncbi:MULTISPECIES: cell division protein SepF [Enterococcus]|uniref:Cell division protein SepF n=1 Tax=Enterococcus dispar ATCC 51266 TaxID=1139219 RepID=S1NNA2_9ENTE|nr:cell division protein SepF [Enterococcus dispar]EOT41163.1 hypothetical protein OMK_01332 [Enterococcus dispar ATCC 51266]EOW87203.1 hypothetical protein I569_02574 [Enterococcus dispar ATCC 51266]MDT2704491.1 cell division protein SepF [Enterococcus dispar]OJG38686.1 hypothetical protein RV01_GL002132 [Enterococcus dispar]WCG33753.1 cell division protein SepF [Enterococcus dispar]